MENTENKFFTIAEAEAYTDKKAVTIRRLIKRLEAEGNKTDIKKVKGRSGETWTIAKAKLDQEYTESTQQNSQQTMHEYPKSDQDNKLAIEILREQLAEKDKQIERLHVLLSQKEQTLNNLLPAPKYSETIDSETVPTQDYTRSVQQETKPKKKWWKRVIGLSF